MKNAPEILPPHRMVALLSRPRPDISLPDLADELNLLAKLRQGARLAFCTRLAAAYIMVTGRKYGAHTQDGSTAAFVAWCRDHIHSSNGKRYTRSTLIGYLTVGFADNPQEYLQHQVAAAKVRLSKTRNLAIGVINAVNGQPPFAPKAKLLDFKKKVPSDVSLEVNTLMTAWEQASTEARKHFIYFVTGQRI